LQGAGHVADLVEEGGSPIRQLQEAFLLSLGIGEGALFMAKQLAFQQAFGQGGAGDVHEGMVGPVGIVVDRLGDEVFPGTAFTAEKDSGGAAVGHVVDQLEELPHLLAIADDAVDPEPVPHLLPEVAHLAFEGGGLQALLDGEHQLVHFEGLADVIERTEPHGLDGGFDAAVGGHEDHDHVGVLLADLAEHVEAGHIGQLVVEKDEVVDAFAERLEAGLAGLGFVDHVAFLVKLLFERPADQLLVFDNQYDSSVHQTLSG